MFIWKLPVLHDAHQFVAQLKHEPNKKKSSLTDDWLQTEKNWDCDINCSKISKTYFEK